MRRQRQCTTDQRTAAWPSSGRNWKIVFDGRWKASDHFDRLCSDADHLLIDHIQERTSARSQAVARRLPRTTSVDRDRSDIGEASHKPKPSSTLHVDDDVGHHVCYLRYGDHLFHPLVFDHELAVSRGDVAAICDVDYVSAPAKSRAGHRSVLELAVRRIAQCSPHMKPLAPFWSLTAW